MPSTVTDMLLPAIVTNARNRIAYNITRSLGQKGISIHTGDFVKYAMSHASIYSSANFRYPSPFSDQEGFLACLLQKVQGLRECVLIPVFEETFLIAKHHERFKDCARMVIPSYDQILWAHNKDRWQELAVKLGIAVPESYTIASLQGKTIKQEDIRFPLLIKPKQGGGGWAITQVNSAPEIEALLASQTYCGLPWERFFCQQKIIGENHCVAMLFCHGELRAKVAYKQLRDYPITGGQATLRISLRNEAAEESLERMLNAMAWHGVCQADFVVDERTGTPYLIDINPRFWGSLAQAIASGVDFPHLLYLIACQGDVNPVTSFKPGVTTRWIGGDLRTFIPLLKRSPHKIDFAKQYFFPAQGASLHDDLSWEDPWPFCMWFWDAIMRVVRNRSLDPVAHDSLSGIWE